MTALDQARGCGRPSRRPRHRGPPCCRATRANGWRPCSTRARWNSCRSRDERSGVVAGVGLVHGVGAVAFASDARVQGGAMGTAGCAAIVAAYAEALSRGVPIVGLWHSGGARLAEGVASLHAVGTVFAAMTRASGRVPQISVVLGPAAGGAAYGPGADRHRDPVRAGTHLRHRPGRGALGHRRGRGHGTARRPRAAQPPVRRGTRGDRDRRGRARPGPAARGHAQRPGQDHRGRGGA